MLPLAAQLSDWIKKLHQLTSFFQIFFSARFSHQSLPAMYTSKELINVTLSIYPIQYWKTLRQNIYIGEAIDQIKFV